MQQAPRAAPEPDHSLLVADHNGLRVLARSEAALSRVAEELQCRFGATLVVGTPAVRYADCEPVLESYMVVLINAPASHLAAVRKDFVGRRGRIVQLVERGSFVLKARHHSRSCSAITSTCARCWRN